MVVADQTRLSARSSGKSEGVSQNPPATPPSISPDDQRQALQAQSLLDDCRAAASSITASNAALTASNAARDEKTVVALEKASRLYDHLQQNSAIAKGLFEQNDIRVTKATKNEFTPVVKLVFGSDERSTVSRYAKVLRYVAASRMEDEEFSEVIERSGGIVDCARADSARQNGPARQRATEKLSAHLEDMRANSVPFANKRIGQQIDERFTALLVERFDDGTLKIIGTRVEPDSTVVSRYKTIRR